MYSHCKQDKGYILTLEAVLCLSILAVALAQVQLKPQPDLNKELTYQLTQDMVETCIKNNTPEEKCFSKINQVNPYITLSDQGNISFTRKINGETKKIKFKLS